jgi:hypothetical protein
VLVRFGRAFAKEAGVLELAVELDAGASAAELLRAVASGAPELSCVSAHSVDLAVAILSVNGVAVDARFPERHALHDGDAAYLASPISGG